MTKFERLNLSDTNTFDDLYSMKIEYTSKLYEQIRKYSLCTNQKNSRKIRRQIEEYKKDCAAINYALYQKVMNDEWKDGRY